MDRRLWKRYWRRALWTAWFVRFVPYVRMVGLNGSMVTGKLHEGSDIDFFVVLKEGRIFTGRVLVTLIVHLLGVRRHHALVAGRVCLNRYASDSFLVIQEENDYHARVFHNLVPLFSTHRAYERYRLANAWMDRLGHPLADHEPILKETYWSWLLRGTAEQLLAPFSQALEDWLRQRHLRRTAEDPRVRLPGSKVVISDQELRFHLAKD